MHQETLAEFQNPNRDQLRHVIEGFPLLPTASVFTFEPNGLFVPPNFTTQNTEAYVQECLRLKVKPFTTDAYRFDKEGKNFTPSSKGEDLSFPVPVGLTDDALRLVWRARFRGDRFSQVKVILDPADGNCHQALEVFKGDLLPDLLRQHPNEILTSGFVGVSTIRLSATAYERDELVVEYGESRKTRNWLMVYSSAKSSEGDKLKLRAWLAEIKALESKL